MNELMKLPNQDNHHRIVVLHFRRFETKFMVSSAQRQFISKYLHLHLKRDPFAGKAGTEVVTSLYFDSPGLKFYHDNEAGLKCREKIRYRYYDGNIEDLFWEVKRKVDSVVIKDRCIAAEPKGRVATYIAARKTLFRLRPTAWVRYRREPWVGSDNLRVTFDRELETARVTTGQREMSSKTRHLLPGWEIMELKYIGKLPNWLYRLTGQFNLQREAISKYRLAIEKLGMV